MNKKNNWKYTSKSKSKTKTKPPQAFVTPPATTAGASRKINAAKRGYFEHMANMKPHEMLGSVHKANKTFEKHLTETALKTVVTGLIDHSMKGILNRNHRKFSFIEKKEDRPGTASTPDRYVTSFTTGKPSTESVTRAAQLHGTTTEVIYDTIKNLKAGRRDLRLSFGFNQKRFCLLGEKFYANVTDYLIAFGMNNKDKGWKYPINDDQSAYGCVVKQSVKLEILNSDKYLDSIFKIHLIDIRDKDLSLESVANISFSGDVKNKVNEAGVIPNRYQISNLSSKTSNKLLRSVLCTKNARLDMSPAFSQNCSVVRTFRKELPAGAIWEFNLHEYCGSGVRLDQVYYDSKLNGKQPAQYAIVIEAVGTQTAGESLAPENCGDKYIGTSPGWFNLEVKKTIEFVNETSVINGSGGFEASKYHIRLYSDDKAVEQDFNVSVDEIESSSPTFCIPVLTDKEEQNAGER